MLEGEGFDLGRVPVELRGLAREQIAAGRVLGCLGLVDNMVTPLFVADNIRALRAAGVYEQAVLDALNGVRVNFSGMRWLPGLLLHFADPVRLRAAGAPLPGPGPFTVYRGVAGRGAARWVRGLFWTGSIERARWFAQRFAELGDPAVFTVTVTEAEVLAHVKCRDEDEYLVRVPPRVRPRRVA